MSVPAIGANSDINPCYFYMKELKRCFENHLYPHSRCTQQQEDYNECFTRQKHKLIMSEAYRQMRKSKVINVPTYDPQFDIFVFDDGSKVSDNDEIFKKFNWL